MKLLYLALQNVARRWTMPVRDWVDPLGFIESNPPSFNRYAYGNNNPYKYIDPDGQAAVLALTPPVVIGGAFVYYAATPEQRAQMGRDLARMGQNFADNMRWIEKQIGLLTQPILSTESGEGANGDQSNSNPYSGPVDRPVIGVDQHGNAIPVGEGEQISASPSGDYQQVRDRRYNETGIRLDRGGHRNQPDPRARAPHAHVPNVTMPDGNPHLPINH